MSSQSRVFTILKEGFDTLTLGHTLLKVILYGIEA
jgi:hypothetical protein